MVSQVGWRSGLAAIQHVAGLLCPTVVLLMRDATQEEPHAHQGLYCRMNVAAVQQGLCSSAAELFVLPCSSAAALLRSMCEAAVHV